MRIKTIVEMIEGANTLLDIGTDHGHVIVEALKKGIIKNAIATDINKGPLKRAFNNITKEGLSDKVTFIQTDGFVGVDLDYDVVVITGLGSMTITEILNQPHKNPKFYIFGPQKQIESFRRYLSDNNYQIIDENIIYNKRTYIFIKAINGESRLKEEDILLGPILKTKKEAVPYYIEKINKLSKKMQYLSESEKPRFINIIETYKKAVSFLK